MSPSAQSGEINLVKFPRQFVKYCVHKVLGCTCRHMDN